MRSRRRDTDARWLPIGALASAPLWLGGATATAHLMVVAVTLVAMVATAWHYRNNAAVPPAALWWLAGAAVWTGVQALPLPVGWVEAIAPAAAEHARATGRLLATDPRFTLSEDPGRTASAFVTATLIVGAAFTTTQLVRRGRRIVFRAVVAVGVLLAATALAHAAVGADRLFGVYTPRFARPTLMAPLLNDNQLAGVLAACVPLALELGRRAELRRLRMLAYGSAVLCAATAIGTLSRGAIPSLLVGVGLQALALRARTESRKSWIAAVSVVGVAVLVVTYIGSDRLLTALGDQDLSKLDTMYKSLWVVGSAPWVGVGRGAFTVAFAHHHGMVWRFEQPENWPILWLAEWGWIVGPAIAVGLGRALLTAFRSSSTSRIAAAAAVGTLVVHDLVDFSLEQPGVAVMAAMLFAACVTTRANPPLVGSWRSRAVAWGPISVSVVVGASSLFWIHELDVTSLEDELRGALSADADISADLERALRAHPSEPNFVLFGASYYVRRGSDRAPGWLNRAMWLAPEWPQPHVLAAQHLGRRGRANQARLELREAALRDPRSIRDVMCWVIHLERPVTVENVLQVVPSEREVEVLAAVSTCLRSETSVAERLDARLLELDPTHPGAIHRVSGRLRARGETEQAIELARSALEARHDVALAARLIELLLDVEHVDEAEAVLDTLHGPRTPRLASLRAVVAQAGGRFEEMREAVEEMRGLSATSVQGVIESYRLLATLEARSGNDHQSLAAWEDALRLSDSVDDLRSVVRAAEAAHNSRRARSARRELCAISPADC